MLQLPVPALEPVVRPRLARWAPDFLLDCVHAHVTVLAPAPTDLAVLDRLLAGQPALPVTLRGPEVFPDGLVHLRPEPAGPLATLTRRAAAATGRRPYGGRYQAVPHLSLDHEPVRESELAGLPRRVTLDRACLHWYEPRASRCLARWELTPGSPAAPAR